MLLVTYAVVDVGSECPQLVQSARLVASQVVEMLIFSLSHSNGRGLSDTDVRESLQPQIVTTTQALLEVLFYRSGTDDLRSKFLRPRSCAGLFEYGPLIQRARILFCKLWAAFQEDAAIPKRLLDLFCFEAGALSPTPAVLMFNTELYPLLSPHVVETYYLKSLFRAVVEMIKQKRLLGETKDWQGCGVNRQVWLSVLAQIFLQLHDNRPDEKFLKKTQNDELAAANATKVSEQNKSRVLCGLREGRYADEIDVIVIACTQAIQETLQIGKSQRNISKNQNQSPEKYKNDLGKSESSDRVKDTLVGSLACKCLLWLTSTCTGILTADTCTKEVFNSLTSLFTCLTDALAVETFENVREYAARTGDVLTGYLALLSAQLHRLQLQDNNSNDNAGKMQKLSKNFLLLLQHNPQSNALAASTYQLLDTCKLADVHEVLEDSEASSLFAALSARLSTQSYWYVYE